MKKTTFTAFLILFLTEAFAQPGFLDPLFGNTGKKSITLPGYDRMIDVALLPNGKILVLGTSFDLIQSYVSLALYNPDGSADSSFGQDGATLLQNGNGDALALGIQSDGKIVVLYTQSYGDWYLVRFLANGQPDVSGAFPLKFNPDDNFYTMAIDSDDKIILAGSTGPYPTDKPSVARLNPDGTKDTSFGINSLLTFSWGSGHQPELTHLLLQPDGRILAGSAYSNDYPLARILPNGTLDSSFDEDGIAVIELAGLQDLGALTLQADGKIIVAGSEWKGPVSVIRLDALGALDETFGLGGFTFLQPGGVVTDMGTASDGSLIVACKYNGKDALVKLSANGVPDMDFGATGVLYLAPADNRLAIQPNQRIVVAGTIGGDFGLARYLPGGGSDSTFNNGALVTTAIGRSGGAFHALALQPDGRIVAVGSNNDNWPGGGLAVARFDGAGTPDFGAHPGGFSITGGYSISKSDILLQPDGKILAGGGSILERFLPDGSFDSGFVCPSNYPVNSLKLLPDGKILAIGAELTALPHEPDYYFLTRYHPDGNLDSTFGPSGVVTTQGRHNLLALQADGKILTGSAYPWGGSLYRYLPDGAADTVFFEDFFAGENYMLAIWPQPDGKIQVAIGGEGSVCIVQYLGNGTWDESFGSSGFLCMELSSSDMPRAITVLPDGKFLVAGERQAASSDFFLARFLPDGMPDNTAGAGGFVVTDFDGGDDVPNALAVQSDGKIILAGTSEGLFALARYNVELVLEAKEIFGHHPAPIKVLPNPVTDFLQIELPESADQLAEVQVFDTPGRLLLHDQLAIEQPFDARRLPPGAYILKVFAGGRAYAGRFVKL